MSSDPETSKAAIIVGMGSNGRNTAKSIASTTLDNTQYCPMCEEAGKQLEAAKQRELELLAVIERKNLLLADAAEDIDGWGQYASEYFQTKWDLAGDVAKYLSASKVTEPSQALREHEAKVLEDAADWFENREVPAAPEALRRMAEERRKK